MNNIEDEQQLRKLMARYVDAVNRADGDAWKETWAEDGRWALAGQEVCGRENIIAFWHQMMQQFEFAIMMPSSGGFDIQGEQASGHWYIQEYTRDREGNAAGLLSRYRDSYSKIDGQWFYQSRAYDVMYYGPGDLSGSYTALPQGLQFSAG
jgi:ketosteroid isomerase-like protein